jgi:hypothetical protein
VVRDARKLARNLAESENLSRSPRREREESAVLQRLW